MPEADANNQPNEPAEGSGKSPSEPVRRTSITPEQRRLLGSVRPLRERSEKGEDVAPAVEQAASVSSEIPPEPRRAAAPRTPRIQKAAKDSPAVEGSESQTGKEQERRERANPASVMGVDRKSSRATEMQRIFLIIGAIFVLGLTFHVGKKFAYWKYLLTSRKTPALSQGADKFPGVSSDELVKQALVLEQSNKWQEAAERFIAAKNKNPGHRGILFHVGKLLLDHRNLDNADTLFERAIAFGEDVGKANYFRGVIAAQRRDLPASARFFEAAVNADPFESEYYYFRAEVLRMDSHPREAVTQYEQAALRAKSTQEEKVCRFKIRLAQAEAAESMKVNEEVEIIGIRAGSGSFPSICCFSVSASGARRG